MAVALANSLDFDQMLSAPFNAIAKSQAALSLATIEFVNTLTLDLSGNLKTTTISAFYDDVSGSIVTDNGGVTTRQSMKSLTIPFISLVNIPSFQIQKMTLNLDISIDSITKEAAAFQTQTDFEATNDSGGFMGLIGNIVAQPEISIKVSGATQNEKSNENSQKVIYKIEVVGEQVRPRGINVLLDWASSSQNPVERNRSAPYNAGQIDLSKD
jgi:hypothetical protein